MVRMKYHWCGNILSWKITHSPLSVPVTHWLIVVYDGAKKRGKTKPRVGAFGALRPLVVGGRMGCQWRDLDVDFPDQAIFVGRYWVVAKWRRLPWDECNGGIDPFWKKAEVAIAMDVGWWVSPWPWSRRWDIWLDCVRRRGEMSDWVMDEWWVMSEWWACQTKLVSFWSLWPLTPRYLPVSTYLFYIVT